MKWPLRLRLPASALLFMPLRSMTGRVFAVLLSGIMMSAAMTGWLAMRDKDESLRLMHEGAAAERIAAFVQALDATPSENRAALLHLGERMGLHVDIADGAPLLTPDARMSQRVSRLLARPVEASVGQPGDCRPMPPHRTRTRPCHRFSTHLQDGTPLQLSMTPGHPGHSGSPGAAAMRQDEFRWRFWLGGLIFAAGLLLVSWLAAQLALRPLSLLARAADNFGRNVAQPDLPANGPSEIRHAAAAFNRMQARIREHLSQRTQILAAITHDLQTPLTRLRLRLEKVADEALREQLIRDLAETQSRVREGLELARSLDGAESCQPLDLDALLESACIDAEEAGQSVTFVQGGGLTVLAAPAALLRCLENLISNAVKYGQTARISATSDGGFACVQVRDQGPGIPEAALESVFAPFVRLESSRSRETGGTGLGLTIVRNLIERQGGSIALRNLPEGGLEACLRIPLALPGHR